jgi:predicted Zn-dependent protease
MTDETPTPAPVTPPEATPPSKKRGLPLPPISGRRKFLAIGLAVAACVYLLTLKHGVTEEQETREIGRHVTNQQRDLLNEEIVKALNKNYKGESRNSDQTALVNRVGAAIITQSEAKDAHMKFRFHLLAEPDSINLYGLSTGDIYITTAMLNRMQTEGQLAAALAHGVAHAMAGDMATPVMPGKHPLPLWQHSLEQEHTADILGLRLMAETGYDPGAMATMLTILAKAYNAGADVSFFTTHPNAADRLTVLDATIKQMYPSGLPAVMSK